MQWHSPSSLLRNLIRSQVFGIVVTCSNQNQFSESVLLLNVNCCLEVWGWEVKTKLICSAELPAWCHLWLPALFRNHFSTSCDDRVVVLCSILYVSASLQGRIMFADLLAVEGMKNLIMWSCNFRWVLCFFCPSSHWGDITGKVLQWRNKAKDWCRDYTQRRKWVERETVRRGGVAVISLGVPPVVKTC